MKQVLLSYQSGYTFSVDAIKYFTYNYNTYFVYTLHEEDEKGYVKLYIVKIMEELGEKVSQTIRRVDEWDKIKYIIKKLLDEIRLNEITSFTVLDPLLLNGLTIYENRQFKLSKDLVDILSRDIIEKEAQLPVLDSLTEIDEDILFDTEVLELEEEPSLIDNPPEITEETKEEVEVLEL